MNRWTGGWLGRGAVWVLAAAVAGLCSRAGAQGTGGIAGRVTQQGGGGVSGAEVSVLFQVGSGVHMTVTDVTGAYTLGGLPAGAVFPRAAAPDDNLAAQWYGGAAFCGDQNQSKPCSARVTVVAGQTNRNINFTLPVGGMLVVTVRLSNATLPGGLYGSINVYDTNVNVVAFGMWTGGGPSPMGGSTDGVYRVGGLCPGSYYVNAMAPWSPPWNRYADEFYGDGSAWSGGWGDVPPNAVPVPVSAGQATTISITLDPMARIYGQVTSGAMPLDGQVMLFTEDSPCHPVPQGGWAGSWSGDGSYETFVLPGEYYLLTSVQGYHNEWHSGIRSTEGAWDAIDAIRAGASPVEVPITGSQARVDFNLDPRGGVTGILTSAGQRIGACADVTLNDRPEHSVGWGSVDGYGNYVVSARTAGTYRVVVDATSCGAGVATSAPVAVVDGQWTALNVDVPEGSVVQGYSITGMVYVGGLPAAGVQVRARTLSGSFSYGGTATTTTGLYRISGVPAGEYYLQAAGSGYVDMWYNDVQHTSPNWLDRPAGIATVAVPGAPRSYDFHMLRGGKIMGRVTQVGQPVAGARLIAHAANGREFGNSQPTTDCDGYYTITGLPTGQLYYVELHAHRQGLVSLWYDGVVMESDVPPVSATGVAIGRDGSEVRNVNFDAYTGGTIQGRITSEANGTPLFQKAALVLNQNGFLVSSGETDPRGNYSVGSLPIGAYYVRTTPRAMCDGLQHEWYNNVPVDEWDAKSGSIPGSATAVQIASLSQVVPGIDFALGSRLGGLWSSATPMGGPWYYSGWFGIFAKLGGGWMWHQNHGFLWYTGATESSLWFWGPNLGWFWTGQGTYPFIYRVDSGAWLYYWSGTTNPQGFWNMTTQQNEWIN